MRRVTMRARALATVALAALSASGLAWGTVADASASTATRPAATHHHPQARQQKKHRAKSSRPTFVIKTARVKKLGTVLVNGSGHVLYVFAPDKAKKVTCNSSCQSIWPPATVPAGARLKARGAVKQKLLGTDPNPITRKRIITYDHWPLYRYVTDTTAGVANGQGLDINGGLWWVLRPTGMPIK